MVRHSLGIGLALLLGSGPVHSALAQGAPSPDEVATHVILLAVEYERVEVTEHVAFAGDSSATFSHPPVFTLPTRARDLIPMAGFGEGTYRMPIGGRVVLSSSGFAGRTAVYRYTLPYHGPSFRLVRPLDYPTRQLNLLVTPLVGKVLESSLQFVGTGEVEGVGFSRFTGERLPAQAEVRVALAGLVPYRRPLLWLSLTTGLLLTALLVVGLRRST